MNRLTHSKALVWFGIILVLATGLIHLLGAPENYDEAAYKGILFYLNAAGALIAAIGIYRGQRAWGWSLGLLVTLGSLIGYVISRTIGLPGLEVDDEWFEPMGVASVLIESLYIALYAFAIIRPASLATPNADRGRLSARQREA